MPEAGRGDHRVCAAMASAFSFAKPRRHDDRRAHAAARASTADTAARPASITADPALRATGDVWKRGVPLRGRPVRIDGVPGPHKPNRDR
jgi:hypothetical protein